MKSNVLLNRIGIFLMALVAFLMPLYIVSVNAAQEALGKAEALRLSDNQEQQVALYGEAAGWRGPLNTPAEKALVELKNFGENEELSTAIRINALRLERRALMKGRSWSDVLYGEATERRMVEIAHLETALLGVNPKATMGEASPAIIRPAWQIASQLFFLCWIVLVITAIFRGFEKSGKLIVAPLLKTGSAAATCFILWAWTLTFV